MNQLFLRRAQLLVCLLGLVAGIAVALLHSHSIHTAVKLATPPVMVEPAPNETPLRKPKILDRRRVLTAAPSGRAILKSPTFVELRDGLYDVKTIRYNARLTAGEGLEFHPVLKSGACAELHVRLRSVTRGANVIFDRATDSEAATGDTVDDGAITFWRASGFEERYKPRGDGVEQSFLFESALAGEGDLEFVCDLSAKNLKAQPPRFNRAGGISFLNAAGELGARYGQVVVHDSAKHGISVEPVLLADGRSVRFAIPASFLDTAMFPIEVDPLVGADFLITTSGATSSVGGPTVAPGNNNYLVVWDDVTNPAAPRLFGAIVSSSGIVSAPLPISAVTGLPQPYQFQRVEVAYDGSANWLVVFSDYRQVGPGIRGAIISTTGTLLGGSDFLIAPTTAKVPEFPLVDFNGTDFLVSWQDSPVNQTIGSQVYYARVTTQGVVTPQQALQSKAQTPNQALLFLSSQKPSGDTLLIYRELTETPVVTRSVRIGQDGTIRDPFGTSLFTDSQANGGFGRAIGVTFANGAWQILSSFDETVNSSIYLHQESTAGVITPPTGIFAIVGQGPTGTNADQFPPVSAGPSGWLFLRNERVKSSVYHILGKRVGFDGKDQDPIPFQVDTSTQGVLRAAVAAQTNNLFLVAWLDGRLAPTQPGDAHDIGAALVDVTIAGSAGPALVPVISASPTSGVAPLAVSFDASASTGSSDSLQWDFGDGTTATTSVVSHTYKINGTFTAQLKLTKGSYSVLQTVLITVGGGPGGVGTGTSSQVGVPVLNSADLVPSLFINSVIADLDFTVASNDAVRVGGFVDLSAVSSSLTGIAGSVQVGSVSHPFTLDAKGNFKSDASTTPLVQFSVSPSSGQFVYQVNKDDLRANFDNLGAKNQAVKPAVIVNVPVTVTIGPFSATATQGLSYRATQDKAGQGTYVFLGAGKEFSGSFLINKFSAQQVIQGKNGLTVHSYSIKGQISRPHGGQFLPSETGQFTIKIGNYIVSVPSGQFRGINNKLKYTGRFGISGLKKFSIDFKSGIFNLQLLKVPATGIGGSNLPISGKDVINVDLNLSLQLDLKDEHLDAGRFIFITRKNANAKVWKVR